MTKGNKINRFFLTVSLWILSLTVLMPLLLVIINSFKSAGEADAMTLQLPEKFLPGNYLVVLTEGNVFRSLINSVAISGISVFLSVVLGSMAAFVLTRNKSGINRLVMKYFLAGLVVPVQVITLIDVLKRLHIYNSFQGIILVYVAIFLPMTVMLVQSSVISIPREMDEAAIIDGCGAIGLFVSIILPLMVPVVITVCVTQFMFIWNDFQFPLYLLADSRKWTLVLGVYGFMGKYSTNWNLVSAFIIVASLPVVIAYLFGQKYIISGMITGAVKG